MNVKYNIKKHIIYPAWKILNKYAPHYYIFQNVNLDLVETNQKRILISYIYDNFNISLKNIKHTNILEAAVINKCFIDFGYSVDIMHCQDTEHLKILKNKKYDVIFGFGEPFRMACSFNENAKKIVYLTESEPTCSLRNELARIDYYRERHNKKIPLSRSGKYYKEDDITLADYAICLGNDFTKQGYEVAYKGIKIKSLQPTGMFNNYFNIQYTVPQRNFLWFGSVGAVHKGLDILLDVFKNKPNFKLYIAGLDSSDMHLLNNYKNCLNIINCGFVSVQSNDFLELISQVSFVILPSASEGMSTSVLTCMKHGLIPVVTRNTGIDVCDFGIYLEDYKIDYVSQALNDIVSMKDDEINAMRQKVYNYSKDRFNVGKFRLDLKHILDEILNEGD
ncbi:MAG: glycosyltransferase [Lachnospiraceae bacterium]|nr:glycosyltransferase [Lachnospiraceae bacterium]